MHIPKELPIILMIGLGWNSRELFELIDKKLAVSPLAQPAENHRINHLPQAEQGNLFEGT
jgi:hypothetical protein